jgi:exosortase
MAHSKVFIKTYQKEVLVVILLFAAYLPTIIWMWDRWFAENSYYSHGILVPLVSLFLILKKKDVLRQLPIVPSPWGLRLFIVGIILYWISALLHVYFSSGFSMLIVIAGLVLHFYGEKVFRAILFPLLFLVFMIPLPIIVVAYICFKLKILAAQLATMMLNLIGFSAIQEKSVIKMAHSYVLVEDSCGGLRSLISLIALGCIFAYRLKLRLTKKMVLFVSAIPIAIITNACRIVFLSVVGEVWGAQYTQGFLHAFSGYAVFAFAFLMLFAVKKILTEY